LSQDLRGATVGDSEAEGIAVGVTTEAEEAEEDMTIIEAEADTKKKEEATEEEVATTKKVEVTEVEEEVTTAMVVADQMKMEAGIDKIIRSTQTLSEIQMIQTSTERKKERQRLTMASSTQVEAVVVVNIVVEENTAVEVITEVEVKEVVTEAEEPGVVTTMSKETKKLLAHSLLKTSSSIMIKAKRSPIPTNAIEDQETATLMTSSTRREEWVILTR
jgi:hypothetical protein